jgi:hypothetical protein
MIGYNQHMISYGRALAACKCSKKQIDPTYSKNKSTLRIILDKIFIIIISKVG